MYNFLKHSTFWVTTMSGVTKNCDRIQTSAFKGIQNSYIPCLHERWQTVIYGLGVSWHIEPNEELGFVPNLRSQNFLILFASHTQLGGYQDIFSPKNQTTKINKSPNFFVNYIKSSCIIFFANMFRFFQIIYCLQEESTNFKTKDFELNQVFIYPKIFRYSQIINYRRAIKVLLSFLNFISKNLIYFYFLIFWHAPIPPSCWMPCCSHFFFAYIIFKCFALWLFIIQWFF